MGLKNMHKLAVLIAPLLLCPTAVQAGSFMDWWLTPDQQGRLYFERGEYQKAARTFVTKQWKATSFYKAGDFANAAALFEQEETASGRFMLGNSLAKQEKLPEAIAAYKQALSLQPEFPEAAFNLEWVEGLLAQDNKEYDDAGGTGGKLGADRIVVDERGSQAKGEVTMQELQAQEGLSDEDLRAMWMRRVQTTPGDFLRLKFYHQRNAQTGDGTAEPASKQ